MADITIIGAGASGMLAAITAARQGKSVVLIEHKDKIGKKILATGNGKCNFTNQDMSLEHYNGDKELITSILKQFSMEDCLKLFKELGVFPKNKNGYYYPNSETAASIVNALEYELNRLNIKLMLSAELTDIRYSKGYFDIKTTQGTSRSRKLIIACGLLANPKLGSDGSVFDYVKQLGHRFVHIVPSLCAFNCSGLDFKKISGVRTIAKVALYIDDKYSCEDTGELQLTDYGLSGIPVFQISSHASRALYNKQKCEIVVDFLPNMDEEALVVYLYERREQLIANSNDLINVYDFFNSIFNSKLISAIVAKANINGLKLAKDLSDKEIFNAISVIKSSTCQVISARPMDFAQVCAGGIRTEEIDIHTLESKLVDGLFFCGEILDVDGQCGGYNLQWAWSSGYVAGIFASK